MNIKPATTTISSLKGLKSFIASCELSREEHNIFNSLSNGNSITVIKGNNYFEFSPHFMGTSISVKHNR